MSKLEIKNSPELDDIWNNIDEIVDGIEFRFQDEIWDLLYEQVIINDENYSTIVEESIKMAKLSLDTKKPIYCINTGYNKLYFVDTLLNLKKLFNEALKKAQNISNQDLNKREQELERQIKQATLRLEEIRSKKGK